MGSPILNWQGIHSAHAPRCNCVFCSYTPASASGNFAPPAAPIPPPIVPIPPSPVAFVNSIAWSKNNSSAVNMTGANAVFLVLITATETATPQNAAGYTWVLGADQYNPVASMYTLIFYALGVVGASADTFQINGGIQNSSVVMGFSGVGSALDGAAVSNGASAVSSIKNNPLTPSTYDELVIAALGTQNAPTTNAYAIDSGFTVAGSEPYVSGTYFGAAAAYLIQGASGPVSPTWSWSGSANAQTTALAVQHA